MFQNKHRIPANRELGTIRAKHLLLCEKNLYATLLLEHFYTYARSAGQWSIENEGEYCDPAIYNSLAGVAEWFLGAIGPSEIETAFDFLVEQEYLYYHYADNNKGAPRYERSLVITCDYRKVDAECEEIENPNVRIHARQHTEVQDRKEEVQQPYERRVTPEELKNIKEKDRKEEEARKVKHHISRAKKANLPATLTLEEWIEALEYFQWKCAYCQKNGYTILEHYIPLGHGKGTTADNCVPACGSCNNIKQSWNPHATYGPDMERMKEGFARVQAYLATRI
jgi:5-methylcytosine-specific restriction endonuclease McrA